MLVGQLHDAVGKGGGEQHGLPFGVGRHLFDQVPEIIDESHVEHAVRFINDEVARLLQIIDMLLVIVDQPARRSDQDIDALLQRIHLLLIVDAAVNGEEPEAGELAEPLGFMEYLVGKFAGGRNDERLRRTRAVLHGVLHHA